MALIFMIGLAFGSFANVFIVRMSENNSNLWKPSFCPQCKHPLKWFNLIPLLSWCFQKGRCSYCSSSISWMYPCVEMTVALVFVACFKVSTDFFEASLFALLNYLFIIAITIDLREKLILNTINSAIAITFFFLSLIDHKEIYSLWMTPLIVGGISLSLKISFEKIKNISALGEGDIKLMMALSFGLEISDLPLWFSLAGGLGILTGLLCKKLKQEEQFPFAPALIIAFLITYFTDKF